MCFILVRVLTGWGLIQFGNNSNDYKVNINICVKGSMVSANPLFDCLFVHLGAIN